jgi:hypothetical protein
MAPFFAQLELLIPVIILLALIQPAASLQNDTVTEYAGWTPSPKQRGTADILWSCCLTLLTCSWTVLHLNIPSKRDGIFIIFSRKAIWMLISIIAPELITMQAYNHWYWASKSVPKMRGLGLQEWDITHGFYAEMGGFAVQFDDKTYYTLEFNQISWLIETGNLTIHDLTVSKEDIQDRSKANLFTKSVTCLQASWLVLQCIARTAQHLPVSQLELATCSYVACALITYWFWRDKPLDANQQIMIRRVLKKEVLSEILDTFPENGNLSGSARAQRLESLGHIGSTRSGNFLLYIAGLLFCALHVLAWNYDFPTSKEVYHWRIFATAGTGASGLLLFCSVPYFGSRHIEFKWLGWHATGELNRGWESILFPIMLLSGLLYLAARLYLLFAIFYCLRSMPSRTYETVNWVVYIPHFS